MTNKSKSNFTKIDKEHSDQLTLIIKETVASNFISAKNFTVIDLWNIRRQGKTSINSRKSATFF